MTGESERMRDLLRQGMKEHGSDVLQTIAGGRIKYAAVVSRNSGEDPVPVLVVEKGKHTYFCSFLPADGTHEGSTVYTLIEEDINV
jgi:hypothetical protein